MNNIYKRIQNHYANLSIQERKIAEYILKHTDDLQNININDLSKKIGTSNATITRFAKKLGYDNFVKMKMDINVFVNSSQKGNAFQSKNHTHIFYKRVIEQTDELIEIEQIDAFIQSIKKAKKIIVAGIGSSGLSAIEIEYRFKRMGFPIDAIVDSHMMIMNSVISNHTTVFIGISNSGQTQEVVEALKYAKDKNATTIGISNHPNSPLIKMSDIPIITFNTSFMAEKFINSQLSINYVIDIITEKILEEKPYRDLLEQTIRTIRDKKHL